MAPSVLFVCLGNICRSPLADGVFRQLAADAGLAVHVDSAGTGDWHIGHAPDPRAQAAARQNGLDISDLRARQVTRSDFHRFAHVVAMDSQNLADLEALRPAGAAARLSRLLDHTNAGITDVPDPYYGDAADFAETYRLVVAGAAGLLARIQAELAASG
jgi:protein-tyrosine phosphatase